MGDDLLRDDSGCREAFRRGERWAMEAAYVHYVPLVHTIVCRGVGTFRGFYDPIQREDAIQAVFMAAFEERARLAYDGIRDYASFLRGIAHHVCLQLLDKDRRFARVPAHDPGADEGPNGEAQVLADEARRLAARFREQLSDPLEHAVLDGYFAGGESEEALAARLRVTRYRVRRTVASLQKKMARFQREHLP